MNTPALSILGNCAICYNLDMEHNKQAAIAFLQMIIMENIDEAYEAYVDMNGKHHNTFTPPGMSALQQGMKDAAVKFPHMTLAMLHVLGDGDLVGVHSHMSLEAGAMEFATVHLFRFESGKIVELWDMSQALTNDSPNTDGAF